MMGLRELLADQALPEVSLNNMTLDSRSVESNTIFIAVPGAERDGRDFIHAALEQGAAAVLAEADGRELPDDDRVIAISQLKERIGELADRFYHSPSRQLKIMAVTGTNGKTSIVELTRQLLQSSRLNSRFHRHAGLAPDRSTDRGAQHNPRLYYLASTAECLAGCGR